MRFSDAKDRFDFLFQRYILVISGWIGILAGLAWMFSLLDEGMAFLCLFFGSGMAAIHGHHGLRMGWFDREQETESDRQ